MEDRAGQDLTGKTLGKYKLEERVGRGGMADVYRAYHPNLQRHVAVKVLHQDLSLSAKNIKRFEREAAAVAQLRHYHIVQVYDFDFEGFMPYIVMEFISGDRSRTGSRERKACRCRSMRSLIS